MTTATGLRRLISGFSGACVGVFTAAYIKDTYLLGLALLGITLAVLLAHVAAQRFATGDEIYQRDMPNPPRLTRSELSELACWFLGLVLVALMSERIVAGLKYTVLAFPG